MKKIFNWFFGSFIRSLGRIIAYIFLAYCLFSIFSHFDIDLPFLNNYVVHASTSDVTLQEVYVVRNNDPTYTNGSMSIQPNTCNAIDNYFTEPWVRGSGYSSRMQLSSGSFTGNADLYLIYSTESTNVFYNRTTPDLFVYASTSPFGSNNNAISLNSTSNYSYSYDYFYLPSSISRGTQYVIHVTFDYEGTVNSAGNYYVNVGFKYRNGYNNLFSQIETTTPNNDTSFCFTSPYPYNSYTNYNYNSIFTIVNTDNSSSTIINQNEQIIYNGEQINNSINDSDTSAATSEASDFFSNFSTNTHGLTGIITSPLNAINSLTSTTCTPLVIPLPFVNQNLTLPCMRQIYTDNFGAFMNIYDIVILGIVSYWVMVRIFTLVKDFKNPDHDEIEVLDL